jgi:hypothetical protein
MSRQGHGDVSIVAGDVFGHWTVVRCLGYRTSTTGKNREWFRVKSACGKHEKEIHKPALVADAKHATCIKCTTRRQGNPGKRAKGPGSAKHIELRRCEVKARDHVCGAMVGAAELAEHLSEKHGMAPLSVLAYFGPVLDLDVPGGVRGVEAVEPLDEDYIQGRRG